MTDRIVTQNQNLWPLRTAWFLVCATFSLIFVGGLVTTYQAGMAVPDWPNTYGYNLFLFPLTNWLSGPWNLFIEHGHRLMAFGVGIVTLLLVILVHRTESRTSVRFLSWIALGLVTFQAALGGFRVLLDRQLLAMIHGCTAPAFFAVATALAVVLSPKWNADHSKGNQKSSSTSLTMLALFTLLLIFLQIMIGANLRHITHWMTSAAFGAFVLFHLMIAAVVTGHVIWLYIRCRKQNSTIRRPASILAVLMIVQLALGAGSWIVQYSFPEFLLWIPGSSAYLVLAESFWQSTIVTAHVATGSLMLAAATMLSLRLISTEPDTWRWLQFTRMTPTAQLKWQGGSQ